MRHCEKSKIHISCIETNHIVFVTAAAVSSLKERKNENVSFLKFMRY